MSRFLLFNLFWFLGDKGWMLILLLLVLYFIENRFLGILPNVTRFFKRRGTAKRLMRELKINPSNAASAIELGVVFFEKKKYEKALTYLEKAYERVKDSERLELYRGMTYMELGREREGVEALSNAISINEGAGYGIAYVYLLKHQLESGATDTSKTLEYEKQFWRYANTENLYKMGKVYKKLGDRKKAKEMFDKALKEYSYCPKNLRKLHRKWALLARINKI